MAESDTNICRPSFKTFALNKVRDIVAITIKFLRIREGYSQNLKSEMSILFFNHYGISYLLVLSANLQHFKELDRRAESGTRTRDLLITNELLYQLSYFGNFLL